jgi:hypothetical protein
MSVLNNDEIISVAEAQRMLARAHTGMATSLVDGG